MSDSRVNHSISDLVTTLKNGEFDYVRDEISDQVTFVYKANAESQSPKKIYLSSELKKFCGNSLDSNGNIELNIGYRRVLKFKDEPNIENMEIGDLVALQKDGQLTIYWMDNGKIINHPFSENTVKSIVERLPAIGEELRDFKLIREIASQYNCAKTNIYYLTTDPLPSDLRTGYVIHTEDYDFQDYEKKIKVLEMPDAPKQPFVPASKEVYELELKNMESEKRFLEFTISEGKYAGKKFWAHLPEGYQEKNDKSYPLLLLLDGDRFHNVIPTPSIMDSMIAKGAIQPTITILLEEATPKFKNQPEDGEGSERFKEYDCDPEFSQFVATKFMDIVNQELLKHNVSIVDDPKFRTIGGFSIGGLSSLYVGISNPDIFGHVIAQSPSVWRFDHKKSVSKANLDLAIQNFSEQNKKIDIQITVGKLEKNAMRDGAGGMCPTMLDSVVKFIEDNGEKLGVSGFKTYQGGHNYCCWQGLLSESLMHKAPVDSLEFKQSIVEHAVAECVTSSTAMMMEKGVASKERSSQLKKPENTTESLNKIQTHSLSNHAAEQKTESIGSDSLLKSSFKK